jgi:hypothetical protein
MFSNDSILNKAEKRELKRAHLIYYLRVFDRNTEKLLGHLVDLTPKGVMLVSEEPIAVGETFKVRMMLPITVFGKNRIDFEAESLWSTNDINPDFYDTGFRLTGLDPADEELIQSLVKEYGFNE